MVVNKRKKNSRQRASHTHGGGAMKKRRGAGNRGGRGNAGSGKRADQKKPTLWKYGIQLGKHGFVNKTALKIKAVNAQYIEENLDDLLKKGAVKKDSNGFFHVDLKELGCNKLLGKGTLKNKYNVKADYASKKAIEAVKGAGGSIEVKFSATEEEKVR